MVFPLSIDYRTFPTLLTSTCIFVLPRARGYERDSIHTYGMIAGMVNCAQGLGSIAGPVMLEFCMTLWVSLVDDHIMEKVRKSAAIAQDVLIRSLAKICEDHNDVEVSVPFECNQKFSRVEKGSIKVSSHQEISA
ncbi:hypothetical protein EB796_012996 [Bugula neritina]|uniref:Uncharacterized protein n=1 Tax=Bugula neritina TaxID=10212 RepID=A0A7J7JRW4_BUGNE|nr:hypothetical protein EB796_012996 [Bugula neritina]